MDTCYCHPQPKPSPQHNEATDPMELDAALHELGMLSIITDSRSDYLREKMRKKERSSHSLSSAPLCVVQMNSKFVTKFSLSKNASDNEEDQGDKLNAAHRAFKISSFYEEGGPLVCRSSDALKARKGRMYTPYTNPWKSKCKLYYRKTVVKDIPAAVEADRASPPIVSRQDSGNKSNPSSPVKSQNCHPKSSGSSIIRSRSLDDLEVINKQDNCKDFYCCYGKSDIDTVSQCISKLHVS